MLLGCSLDLKGGLEVLLDIVEDSEYDINHMLIGLYWVSLKEKGHLVKNHRVTMRETGFLKRLKGSDLGGQF